MSNSHYHPRERRQARQLAVQAIYAWQIGQIEPADMIEFQILEQAKEPSKKQKADLPYLHDLISHITEDYSTLELVFQPHLDRPQVELDGVELSILYVATYELVARKDIPPRVILNEALELAKLFGATDSYKFINGVLDKVARDIRKDG